VGEQLAVESRTQSRLGQGGKRAHAHRTGTGGEHEVVDGRPAGEEGVKRRPVRRVELSYLDRGTDPPRCLVQAFLGPPGDDDIGSLARKGPGCRLADPGTGSDDHHLLAVE
jgi:hypothetical protein